MTAWDVSLSQRPITAWPWPKTANPVRSLFKANWEATTILQLRREIDARGAAEAIIEIDARDRDIRRDGWIRADAKPQSSRVVITFEDPNHGWVRYRCDRFTHWHDNVRAIVLALESLRRVERYGISDGEQYHGFRSGRALPGHVLTSREAAEMLSRENADEILSDPKAAKMWILGGIKRAHPDVPGGSASQLYAVQAARDTLEQHHGCDL